MPSEKGGGGLSGGREGNWRDGGFQSSSIAFMYIFSACAYVTGKDLDIEHYVRVEDWRRREETWGVLRTVAVNKIRVGGGVDYLCWKRCHNEKKGFDITLSVSNDRPPHTQNGRTGFSCFVRSYSAVAPCCIYVIGRIQFLGSDWSDSSMTLLQTTT